MPKKVNWRQAFVEVVLLLLGASLALSLDAWNDRRLGRQAEYQYLVSLRADFEQTRANFQRAQSGNEEVRDLNLHILELLSGAPGSVPADSLRRADVRGMWIWEYEPVLGTYQDLVQSGRLDVLGSDSLRVALIQFESGLRRLNLDVELAWSEWSNFVAPFFLEEMNVARYYGDEYRGIEIPPSRFPADSGPYWSLQYANLRAMTAQRRHDVVRMARSRLSAVDDVIRLIDRALGEF